MNLNICYHHSLPLLFFNTTRKKKTVPKPLHDLACESPENIRTIYLLRNNTIYLWLCSPFVALWSLFSSLIFLTQSVGHLGRAISPSQGRCLHTGQQKHGINANRHPCLEWNSNPRSQCLSGRRQLMPLGTTLPSINEVSDTIRRRMSSANACYHSAGKLLLHRLLLKRLQIVHS
jgi:hypothetical protein